MRRPSVDVGWRVTDKRTPDFGWVYYRREVPLGCRWCDTDMTVTSAGWLICPQCDVPPPPLPPIVRV